MAGLGTAIHDLSNAETWMTAQAGHDDGKETDLAKYKIATPAGASFTVAGGGYDLEMEPLEGIDCRDRRRPHR